MAQAYRLVALLREGRGAREAAEGLGSTQEPGGGADSPLGGGCASLGQRFGTLAPWGGWDKSRGLGMSVLKIARPLE